MLWEKVLGSLHGSLLCCGLRVKVGQSQIRGRRACRPLHHSSSVKFPVYKKRRHEKIDSEGVWVASIEHATAAIVLSTNVLWRQHVQSAAMEDTLASS